MKKEPIIIASAEERNTSSFFIINVITENNIIGIAMSFKCSHILSFTGENKPTISILLNMSYVKCNSVPNNIAAMQDIM